MTQRTRHRLGWILLSPSIALVVAFLGWVFYIIGEAMGWWRVGLIAGVTAITVIGLLLISND